MHETISIARPHLHARDVWGPNRGYPKSNHKMLVANHLYEVDTCAPQKGKIPSHVKAAPFALGATHARCPQSLVVGYDQIYLAVDWCESSTLEIGDYPSRAPSSPNAGGWNTIGTIRGPKRAPWQCTPNQTHPRHIPIPTPG